MHTKQRNLLENPSDRRRRAHRKSSKRVYDGEPIQLTAFFKTGEVFSVDSGPATGC